MQVLYDFFEGGNNADAKILLQMPSSVLSDPLKQIEVKHSTVFYNVDCVEVKAFLTYTVLEYECIGIDGLSQFHCLLKKIDQFGIRIEVCYKKLNPEINLPFFNSEIFLP